MKSKELKVYNLPQDGVPIYMIDAKPNYLLLFIFTLGFLSILINVPLIISGMLMFVPFIIYVFTPSVVLIEFYENYLVLRNKADRSMCSLIYYEDVASWHYSWSATKDELIIELDDGSVEKIKTFSKTTFEFYMNRFLKEKKKKIK